MKVFLDTNVFLEYLCARKNVLDVKILLDVIDDGNHEAFLSTSCFCTIAYYVEKTLKERGIHKPEKTIKTRDILNMVLEIATIIDLDHNGALRAINNLEFSDFEDSMQYQCALGAKCDMIVTFNVKDFSGADCDYLRIVTPSEAINLL